MSGLGRVMPWTFGAFALASLSMIGAPPVPVPPPIPAVTKTMSASPIICDTCSCASRAAC